MNHASSIARHTCGVVLCLLLGSCGGTTPVTPTPTPTYDPPVISCPASQSLVSFNSQPMSVVYGTPSVSGGAPPITASCTPVSGAIFPVGITTVKCTASDAQQRTSNCSLTVGVTLPPRLQQTDFVAFGDSITAGENGQNPLTADVGGVLTFLQSIILFGFEYPTDLRNSLQGRYTTQAGVISVSNQGNPGEAASAPATLTRFSSAIVGHKVVLLMEGSNDLYLAYSSGSSVTDTALVNLRTMVLRARTAGLMPLIATVPPMNPTACTPICRGFAAALVPAFNDRIRALASGEGVTLVDVNKAFNGDFSLLSDDGLHPNAQGYATIANTFFDAIRTTLE